MQNKQITVQTQWMLPSLKLIECMAMANSDVTKEREYAKMQMVTYTGSLMPGGVPSFKDIAKLPAIAVLLQDINRADMMKALLIIVKDFCDSFNVVRNMNIGQQMDAASMLLDECGTFRLEDYTVMFTLAKRGQLVKILDHIDMYVIGQIMDAYHQIRHAHGLQLQEQAYKEYEARINSQPEPDEPELNNSFGKLVGIMKAWQADIDNEEKEKEDRQREARNEQILAYAEINNINIEEVLKQFTPKPKP